MRKIIAILGLSLPLLPIIVSAAIVPCDGPNCQACDFAKLGQNVLNFLVQVSVILAGIAIAWAGILMVTSGGDSSKVSTARNIFTNVIIGIIIVLSAWLIIDTVVKVFVDESKLGPWNTIQCTAPPGSASVTSPTTQAPSSITPSAGTQTGCATQCVTLDPSVQVKSGACSAQTCTVSSQIAGNINTLSQNLSSAGISTSDWRITEAYPPTRTHQAACHTDGTCIDANFTGTPTASQINTFITQANSSGLRAVYEVGDQATYNSLIQADVPQTNVLYLPPKEDGTPQITAPHFSVYSSS